eukprot:11348723-Heterocapsa_arctica.AAC.1
MKNGAPGSRTRNKSVGRRGGVGETGGPEVAKAKLLARLLQTIDTCFITPCPRGRRICNGSASAADSKN